MEFATIIGLVAGFGAVTTGIFIGGGLIDSFISISSIVITLGGTFAAMLASFSPKDIKNYLSIIAASFKVRESDISSVVGTIITLSSVARREGLLSLEESVHYIENVFLRKGVMLIVDGNDPDQIKSILEAEISFDEMRHRKALGFLEALAAYAPGFGLIGTIVGLITMLGNAGDSVSVAVGVASALAAVFYGVLLAYMVFVPIAAKFKNKSAEELLYKKLILEGAISVQLGESPRLIEEKLYSFIPGVPKNIRVGE